MLYYWKMFSVIEDDLTYSSMFITVEQHYFPYMILISNHYTLRLLVNSWFLDIFCLIMTIDKQSLLLNRGIYTHMFSLLQMSDLKISISW